MNHENGLTSWRSQRLLLPQAILSSFQRVLVSRTGASNGLLLRSKGQRIVLIIDGNSEGCFWNFVPWSLWLLLPCLLVLWFRSRRALAGVHEVLLVPGSEHGDAAQITSDLLVLYPQ